MHRHFRLLKLAGLGCAFLLAACGEQAPANAPETPPAGAADPAPASVAPAGPPVAPVGAQGPEGDAYRGAAIAQQVCVQCHDVGVEGLAPKIQVGAPAFPDVANGDGVTAAGLADWMRKSHPAMPNFIFDEPSVAALSAYIMSLRKAQ